MRVFLLNPPIEMFEQGIVRGKQRLWPPTSLAVLASILREEGHPVELLDANAAGLGMQAILGRIGRFAPDVVVYSSGAFDTWQCPSPGIDPIIEFAAALRGTGPILVVSGPHGTLLPDELMRAAPGVDYLVRGEPERTTAKLVTALERGISDEEIAGVSRRAESGAVEHGPEAPMIEDLDGLPFPALDLLPIDRYLDGMGEGKRFLVTAMSRGCTLHCGFCNKSMFGDAMRYRSAEHVVRELEIAAREHGVERVLFHDQNFVAQPRRVKELCRRLVEAGLPLEWRCQTTLFRGDPELLELMGRAGCTEVHIGLESGSPEVLERLRKGDLTHFMELVERGRRVGIRVLPNNLIGLPGDSLRTVMESMDFFHVNGFSFRPWVAIPYPGTALYRVGVESGQIEPGNWTSVVGAAGLVDNDLDEAALRRIFRRARNHELKLRLRRLRPRALVRRLVLGSRRRANPFR